MKFKRILSVMLAGVIASMTATTLWAEEDYGLVYGDTECFGSLILEKMIENAESETVSSGNVYPGNEGIAPAWANPIHNGMIKDGTEVGDSYQIPSSLLTVMKKINNECDSTYSYKNGYGTCIHGGRNYFVSLKFLWEFAKKLNTKSAVTASQVANYKQQCINMIDKNKIISTPGTGKVDYDNFLMLATITEKVVNKYRTHSDFSGKNKKYIVYALIYHLLGDVTAHRTIIPKFMVTRATDPNYKNSQNRFDKSDFTSAEWTKTVNAVNNANLCFSDLHTNYIPNIPRSKYEDNPKVVPNRVDEAETMLNYFLQVFNMNVNSVLETTLQPIYANVKLEKFDTYKKVVL